MHSMPAPSRFPVSEFESPKLKTAWNLKLMDCAGGEKMDINVRTRMKQFLVSIDRLGLQRMRLYLH